MQKIQDEAKDKFNSFSPSIFTTFSYLCKFWIFALFQNFIFCKFGQLISITIIRSTNILIWVNFQQSLCWSVSNQDTETKDKKSKAGENIHFWFVFINFSHVRAIALFGLLIHRGSSGLHTSDLCLQKIRLESLTEVPEVKIELKSTLWHVILHYF